MIEIKDLTRRFASLMVIDSLGFIVETSEAFELLELNKARKTTRLSMPCTIMKTNGGKPS